MRTEISSCPTRRSWVNLDEIRRHITVACDGLAQRLNTMINMHACRDGRITEVDGHLNIVRVMEVVVAPGVLPNDILFSLRELMMLTWMHQSRESYQTVELMEHLYHPEVTTASRGVDGLPLAIVRFGSVEECDLVVGDSYAFPHSVWICAVSLCEGRLVAYTYAPRAFPKLLPTPAWVDLCRSFDA